MSGARDSGEDGAVWCVVDLAAYRHNLRELRRAASPGARLMAVVKADAYGHGAVPLAREAMAAGSDWLGVARLSEAVELRRAGLSLPILLFGDTPAAALDRAVEHELTISIVSRVAADELSAAARRLGRSVRCHLKIDSGMGRLGLVTGHSPIATVADEVESICRLAGLEVDGIYTHFASADHADLRYARRQLELFGELLAELGRRGVDFRLRHAANSAALLTLPESHLDLVRPGIATYGLWPSDEARRDDVDLRPVLQWETRVLQVKRVPAGFAVGYGMTHTTARPTVLATLGVGYADGLDRHLSSRGQVLLHGRCVPIVGRVSMDLTVVDVGEVPEVEPGDVAVLCGRQGETELPVDEMASTLGTINYEIVSRIAPRVPRRWVG